jgi:RHS repeat-associated protein
VYSPYGTIRYRQSNFDTPFLYGGFFGVMTDANGLIAMRARYYNPLTMRFLNSDPAMDGLNWYAYAGGNPINFADPTGYGASRVLDAMQGGLTALGFAPGVGAVADLVNAGISAGRGDFVGAGFNLASSLPGLGDAFAAGKIATAAVGVAVAKSASHAVSSTAATAAKVEAAVVKEGVTGTTAGVVDDAFSHGLKYHPRIRARGVEDGVGHNFPYSLDDAIFKTKPITQADGSLLYRMPGNINKTDGIFEMAVNPQTQTIFHRQFRGN